MDRPAQSAIRNRLLRGLSSEDFGLLSPYLESVELHFKQVLVAPDRPITHAYFPDAGISSNLALFKARGAQEVGLIGRDGMVGFPVVLGIDAIPDECMIQVPGQGWRIETGALRKTIGQSPSLQALLLRNVGLFLIQVSRTAACNGAHSVEQRLARWLLMVHDRSDGDRLPLTQELISIMLGVRRAGVTVAAGNLQEAGIIEYISGQITVLNRPALEKASCECYAIVKGQADLLLPA